MHSWGLLSVFKIKSESLILVTHYSYFFWRHFSRVCISILWACFFILWILNYKVNGALKVSTHFRVSVIDTWEVEVGLGVTEDTALLIKKKKNPYISTWTFLSLLPGTSFIFYFPSQRYGPVCFFVSVLLLYGHRCWVYFLKRQEITSISIVLDLWFWALSPTLQVSISLFSKIRFPRFLQN